MLLSMSICSPSSLYRFTLYSLSSSLVLDVRFVFLVVCFCVLEIWSLRLEESLIDTEKGSEYFFSLGDNS